MCTIALVVLDTLRKDAFDEHFDWLPGRRFERAYSTANWTVPAHASLFTGRYGSEVAVHARDTYLDCDRPVLAERLSRAGYTTRAFSANTNVSGHFEFDRGFDEFHSPEQQRHLNDEEIFNWRAFSRDSTKTGLARYLDGIRRCVASDYRTVPSIVAGVRMKFRDRTEYGGTAEATDVLADVAFGDDEFLFVNVMEAHEPYRVPEAYRTVDEPDLTSSVGDLSLEGAVDAERTRAAYDDCARYLSDVYRTLFDRLHDEFDYVVTLSDHGELLGEHDAWGHEHGVYPELMRVPLVVTGDGLDGRCREPVSLLDVHRTVLELAGLDGEDSRGRSLLDDLDGRDWLAEYHGLTPWSEQRLRENGSPEQLATYDAELAGCVVADGYGYETVDGVRTTGTLTPDEARSRLADLRADRAVEETATESRSDVPDDVQRRLEDLGYA